MNLAKNDIDIDIATSNVFIGSSHDFQEWNSNVYGFKCLKAKPSSSSATEMAQRNAAINVRKHKKYAPVLVF